MASEVAAVCIVKSDEHHIEVYVRATMSGNVVPLTKSVALEVFIDALDHLRQGLAGGVPIDRGRELLRMADEHPRAKELASWRDVLLAFDGSLARLAEVEVAEVTLIRRYVEDDEPELGPLHGVAMRAVFTDRSLHAFMPEDMYFSSYMIEVHGD